MLDLLTRVWFILLMIPVHSTDQAETNEERVSRMHALASNVTEWTEDPEDLAILLTTGERESFFARYVGEGRCQEGPPGMRCDEGKARSFFQLHRSAAPDLWAELEGTKDALIMSFAGALDYWLRGYRACGDSVPGAFAAYKGHRCDHKSGRSRAKLYRVRLCQLTTQKPWPEVLAHCSGRL